MGKHIAVAKADKDKREKIRTKGQFLNIMLHSALNMTLNPSPSIRGIKGKEKDNHIKDNNHMYHPNSTTSLISFFFFVSKW